MGICCFFIPKFLEPTLRFFKVREVFAENGIELATSSIMSMSPSGVLCLEATRGLASGANLGIPSSLSGTGDPARGGDESGVE
jgi:hypothetical protein